MEVKVDRTHIRKHAVQACRWEYALQKPCLTVPPAEVGERLSTSKLLDRKVIDVQDADISSDLTLKIR